MNRPVHPEKNTGDADEVVELCRDLIRIDTSNAGDGLGPGERRAAEYVAARLAEAGIESQVLESSPRRANLVARIAGTDPARPALLVHGHLDTVPARRHEWSLDPFAGEIRKGCLWGRGAVDMKNMIAMTLTAVRKMARENTPPSRDLVLAFLADEEAGCHLGSRWLAQEHRDLITDCNQAVSEVGGFSVSVDPATRLYMIETGRKGVAWLRLRARGAAGHASLTHPRSAVAQLSAAVHRLAEEDWPLRLTPTSARTVEQISALTRLDISTDQPALADTVLAPVAALLTSSLRHVANPTVLRAGSSINVVPGEAEALVDGRFVPGFAEEFLGRVTELVGPAVQADVIDLTPADESDPDDVLLSAMNAALRAEDPTATIVPYCSSASTDNASFAPLGIAGYGFAPLRLPAGFDFGAMFHGVDERVPLDALRFGADVLHRFLRHC
ncbi:M20/M25/M40 family metallo-hydrolase [Streptomyces sp. NPDC001046]|uniref:M20/M25/M40 family metallo-hydrolase n=1 Tax=unclassified Streptomyces TaxID=2593676 RepID=UPI0036AD61B0